MKTNISPSREKWSNKIDFLLACIGFSVGLGNVWRFPYLCYSNGGGAFLIPYLISVILGGIPMFCLEVFIGQYMAKGGIELWNIVPLFKGIGYASAVVVFLLNCYYNVILAWALFFLYNSFQNPVGWSRCGNSWNTIHCSLDGFKNSTNTTDLMIDPAVEFWEIKVLGISKGIEEVGAIKVDLLICLSVMWIVVFFCIWKGIKTSGKVMYFTATSPYVLMLVLFIRAATLDGSKLGLSHYLYPNWEKLLTMKVWVDAGTQIFFSYSIGLGTLSALGSYNKYNHNSFKDCIIFSLVNSGTSFFAGFVIFMTIGYMANKSNIPFAEVAAGGPGLAFIVYPKALAEMPITTLWSVLFFAMIILLGLDSQFVGVEGFITAFSDIFPLWMNKGSNKQIFIAIVCLLNLTIGLSMITNGGIYVFQIFDYYAGSRIILIIAVLECLVISYVYGINKFSKNLKNMFGFGLWYWPHIFVAVLTPIFLLVIFVMSVMVYTELDYTRGSDKVRYIYPNWSIKIGWSLACSSLICIPIIGVASVIIARGSLKERIKSLLSERLPSIIAERHFADSSL